MAFRGLPGGSLGDPWGLSGGSQGAPWGSRGHPGAIWGSMLKCVQNMSVLLSKVNRTTTVPRRERCDHHEPPRLRTTQLHRNRHQARIDRASASIRSVRVLGENVCEKSTVSTHVCFFSKACVCHHGAKAGATRPSRTTMPAHKKNGPRPGSRGESY